jgi:hypothetical protein
MKTQTVLFKTIEFTVPPWFSNLSITKPGLTDVLIDVQHHYNNMHM